MSNTNTQYWLVTWTTHGSWLPGDPRGFCSWRHREHVPPPRRYAEPGEKTYDAQQYRQRHAEMKDELKGQPVYLTREQQQFAVESLVDEMSQMTVRPLIIAVGRWHVHWLSRFWDLWIRTAVGRLKARASRDLHREGVGEEGMRMWTRGCHMKSKKTPKEILNAYRYVDRHREEGDVVHRWISVDDLARELSN